MASEQMLWFAIDVISCFNFVTSITLFSTLEIVVLTSRAYPSTIRKLKLLGSFGTWIALLRILSERLFFLFVSNRTRAIAWNEMICSRFINLVIFLVRVHQFVQVFWYDTLQFRIIKTIIEIVLWLLRSKSLSLRFFLCLMLYERATTVVMSKRAHKVLRFDRLLEWCIKVTPIIRRFLSIDGSWVP